MRQIVIKPGIRRFHGDELILLQSEPLDVLQAYFKQFGKCIIQGCEITANGGNWDIAAGLVAIDHADGFKVVRLPAQVNKTLPGYLSVTKTVRQKIYDDTLLADDAEYKYEAIFTAGAGNGTQAQLDVLTPDNGGAALFVDAIGGLSTSSVLNLTTTTGVVTAQDTYLHLNSAAKLLHIKGTVTISNLNNLPGFDSMVGLAAPANVPVIYRPQATQYFNAFIQDAGGTPNNFYTKDLNNADYLKQIVCWMKSNGSIEMRFVKPAAPATSLTLELRGVISLL